MSLRCIAFDILMCDLYIIIPTLMSWTSNLSVNTIIVSHHHVQKNGLQIQDQAMLVMPQLFLASPLTVVNL